MIKILISLISCFLLLSKVTATTPPYYFLNADSSTCTSPQIKTSSDLGIETSSTFVCLHQIVRVTDQCSQGQGQYGDVYLLKVMEEYNGVAERMIIALRYEPYNRTYVFLAGDENGNEQTIFEVPEWYLTTLPISYYAYIDTLNNYAYAGFNSRVLTADGDYVSVTGYDKPGFLENVVFYFCNDGISSSSCDFSDTIISYRDLPRYYPIGSLWSLFPTLIRSYEANENSGTVLVDSVSGQDTTFGSNAPIWSKTNYGIEFTSTDQYITILPFAFSPANGLVEFSMTITMWIRLKSFPSVTSYIFRIANSDIVLPSQWILTASLLQNMLFPSFPSSISLTLNRWTLISASYSGKSFSPEIFGELGIQVDDRHWEQEIGIYSLQGLEDNLQMLIGGPDGLLATYQKIKIYNPGSDVYSPKDSSGTQTFGLNSLPYSFSCDATCSACSGTGPSDCLSCSTTSYGLYGSTCQTCPSGTFLADTICLNCPSNCQNCSSTDLCDACNPGYYVENSQKCAKCVDNCKTCSSSTTCDVCSLYYYVDGNQVCSACPQNCESCSSSDKCNVCSTGYVVASNNLCTFKRADYCQSCSSSYKCDVCSTGYVVTSNNLCTPKCADNCQSCSSSNTCDVCSPGYIVTSNNLCALKCADNCKSCSSSNKCDVCAAGYIVTSNKLCAPKCADNCQSCSSSYTCDVCSPEYVITSNNLCTPKCADNCQSCSSKNTCDVCSPGYIVTNNHLCTLKCPDNCQGCSSNYACDICSPGYQLATNQNCVLKCPDNCQSCSSIGTCDICSAGFQMTKNKMCASAFVPDTIAATTGGRTTADTTTQISTIVSNGNSGGVQAQVSGRIFISIQYLNITFSNDVKAILSNTMATPGRGDPVYVPNIPNSIRSGITERKLPHAFEKYGLSSSFILNFWKRMILLLMVFSIITLALSIEFAMTKWVFLKKVPSAMIREYAQNYLLTQLYTCVGDAVLFSTLHFRASNYWSKSELLDFILSIIFLLAVFIVPVWHYFIIEKYQKIKRSRENMMDKEVLKSFQESNKGIKLFFENFQDTSKPQQFFLIFLAVRDMIFSLVITMLFAYPLLQILTLLILSIAMIAFLVIKRPFKNILNLIQQLYYELLVFCALVILTILIGLDMNHSTDDQARDILGKILIMESLLFTYGTLILTVLTVLKAALDYIKGLKKNKAELNQPKEIPTEENPWVIGLEDVGISFPSNSEKEKPSVLDLNQVGLNKSKSVLNEGSSPTTVAHSEANSPQSKLLRSPMGTPGGNFGSQRTIKLSKFKNQKPEENENDNFDLTDKSFDLGTQMRSASPTNSSPSKRLNAST